ncbi:bifunctional riboflavin kinase/FAD synthetase [uncultured Methylovirgula sp.]|uniref:bifunctional riboflavin kinase/FAD synthetase n=1 Tax=uncultured Methylovirgula sp. TaxID=1285960 RepID=UPI00261B7F6E|nr:bifunctional riboflavin kinase/FAD synthetase [uncultured Methylovirgula sp.]
MADPPASPSPSRFIVAVDPHQPPPGLEGAVVAIGNFDGVHRGHVAVLKRAEDMAARLGRPCAVLTFEPHPADFFFRTDTIFRLTPEETKAVALSRIGIDGMIVLSFDAALAAMPAEEFVRDILVRRLHVGGVVAGYDFHFGKGRAGTPTFLAEAGARYGFAVEIVARIAADSSGSIVPASSTETRKALEAGDVERAQVLLGHPYFVITPVVHGDKRGRDLGFPTANLRLHHSVRLRHGIYAVRVRIDEIWFGGVASFGTRPTFDNGAPLLEVYIFDFSGDLYGKVLEVAFVHFLRDEMKFDSVEALVVQMKKDAAAARQILEP